MLEALGKQLNMAVKKMLRKPSVDEEVVNEVLRDIQRALIHADVDVELVFSLSKNIKEKVLQKELPKAINRKTYTISIIYNELVRLLGGNKIDKAVDRGTLMFVGIQGSGKTTSVVKTAYYFKRKGKKPAVICADVFRPGAYEQLKQLADEINVEVYWDEKLRDPVKIALNGVKYFRSKRFDPILIDTAGRHRKEDKLFKEMTEMSQKIKPNAIILVIDATIGQQAFTQAKAFKEATNIGYIFLTKLDGTAKGGGALSAAAATNAPIVFIGTGEKITEIEEFNPEGFVSRLLGMGDIKGLIRKIEQLQVKPNRDITERMMKGKITLYDLMSQLEAMEKLGPFKKIIDYIPGLKYSLPIEAEVEVQENINKWRVIVRSMTKKELEHPEIINKSRIKRIAFGSGTTPKDVRALLKYYKQMKKMVRTLLKQKKTRKAKLGIEPLSLRM